MDTKELIQAASHIAGGIAGATRAHGATLTPQVIGEIAQESVEIALAIEPAIKHATKGKPLRIDSGLLNQE